MASITQFSEPRHAAELTSSNETAGVLSSNRLRHRRIAESPYSRTAALGLLVFGIAFFSGFLNHSQYNDENFYNPLVRYYAERPTFSPLTDTDVHPISIGPFFFQVHRFWSGVFGAGDFRARCFALTLMCLASLLWTHIAVRLYGDAPPILIAAFWLLPFHGVFATCTLAESFMLALLLAALACWMAAADREPRPVALLYCLCGLFLGFAQNAKQPLLALSLALVLFGAFRLRSRWSILGPLIAIFVQLPFWVRWGNIFPPGQRLGMMPQFTDMSGLFPDTSLHLLTVCGTVLWPALIFDRRSWTNWAVLVLGVSIWFVCGPDLHPDTENRLRFVGPLLQISYVSPVVRWAMIVPYLIGWLVFCDSIRHLLRDDIARSRQILMLCCVVAVFGFIRSPLGFDRYVTCFLPLWWLAFWPELKRSQLALAASLAILFLLSAILLYRISDQPTLFPSPVAYLLH